MEEKVVSEFNENANKIARLHNIWLDCERYSNNGRFQKWNWKLDTAKRELFFEARRVSNEDIDYLINIKEVDKKILSAILMKKRNTLYALLQQKEIILRDIQQESGMGLTHKSAEEDDWD